MHSQNKDIQTKHRTQTRKRHYLHGDQSTENSQLYFCARCNQSNQTTGHFIDTKTHGKTNDIISHINRYQSDTQEWNSLSNFGEIKSYDGITYYRPENTKNFFRDSIKIKLHRPIIEGENNAK